MPEHPRTSGSPARRTVLGGIAGAGAALPLVAACGSGGGSGESAGGDAGSGASENGQGNGHGGAGGKGVIASTSDIPVGGGKILASEKLVVTQPAQGDFKCFSAVCTHQGCLVNRISGQEIDCPCHGSRYSIKDGSVLGGPAPSPLKSEKIRVQGDKILRA